VFRAPDPKTGLVRAPPSDLAQDAERLGRALAEERCWLVLTGAGVSTASGIPAYRDEVGRWQHQKPMTYREFVDNAGARRRYWARSSAGYRRVGDALPNAAHAALAELERMGRVQLLVTQNVDGLHQRAGSRRVVDLHGRLSEVVCLACGTLFSRDEIQRRLEDRNPLIPRVATPLAAPDGDARVEGEWIQNLQVVDCSRCAGLLKPAVVFFGENVPAAVVERVYRELDQADGILVVGSSLTVFSGFRFVRRAAELGRRVVVVNRGKTRADELSTLRIDQSCAELLPLTLDWLRRG
jgi:NAD-dependent SIR2 family protein deacetylase